MMFKMVSRGVFFFDRLQGHRHMVHIGTRELEAKG